MRPGQRPALGSISRQWPEANTTDTSSPLWLLQQPLLCRHRCRHSTGTHRRRNEGEHEYLPIQACEVRQESRFCFTTGAAEVALFIRGSARKGCHEPGLQVRSQTVSKFFAESCCRYVTYRDWETVHLLSTDGMAISVCRLNGTRESDCLSGSYQG